MCIFAPMEFYCLNILDFWFPLKYVLPVITIVSVISFIVLFLIMYKTNGKKRLIFAKIVFVLFICLYIQGNFLNTGYSQMNTAVVEWSSMVKKGIINTIIWIFIILIPFLIKPLKDERKFNKFSGIISGFVILIECITLFVLIIFVYYDGNYRETVNKDYYLDETNIFNMSKEENIVFIMSDSLEGEFLTKALEEHPEYKEIFSDFTFFDNTTGCSVLTYMSMPTLLTGEVIEVGKTLQENINNCFSNSMLYPVLLENDFEVEWYTSLALVPTNTDNQIISNKVNKELQVDGKSKIKLSTLLYECVGYKYMPHFLKSIFYINTDEFNKVTSNEVKSYFMDDVELYNFLIENGVTNNSSKKTFKVIETYGCHYPFTMNENVKEDNSDSYKNMSLEEQQNQEILASLNLLAKYIEYLKKAGVYDNTTIIFGADHGFENRYNPTLMIKKKDEKHDEIVINNAPVSMLEDFIPTILNIASNSKDYGKDVYDYVEGESRQRKVNNFYFARDEKNVVYVESNIVMTTEGQAKDINSYYILDEEFSKVDTLEKEYKFGKKINFLNNSNEKYVKTEGILRRIGDNAGRGTTIGHKASIEIKPKKTNKDVEASLIVKRSYLDNQKIVISANGEKLYEKTIDETKDRFRIRFTIPEEIWNSSDNLKITFDFPNAAPYDDEYSNLRWGNDWVIRAFIFESIKFN